MTSSTRKNLNFLFVILIVGLILVAICYVILSDKGNKTQSVISDLSARTNMALGESVFYKTRDAINNYIRFDMSPNDTFEVAFHKGDKSNKIVANSGIWATAINANGSKTILHLIPQYILKKGYDKISFTPIRGDGDYYVANLQTLMVEDTSTYTNYNVIDFEIKQYEIEISDEDYQIIKDFRKEALELGILHTTDDSTVYSKVKANGETFKTDIRLKGDMADHLHSDK